MPDFAHDESLRIDGEYAQSGMRDAEARGERPAFPQSGSGLAWENGKLFPEHGMTLREWFAGQAMSSVIARPITQSNGMHVFPTFVDAAMRAVKYADALVDELHKRDARQKS